MRVGIIADTHDKKPVAEQAATIFDQQNVTVVVHCGDITTPDIIQVFSEFEVHAVLGNNDSRNKTALNEAINGLNDCSELHGLFAELTFDGLRFAVLHGADEPAIYEHARTGDYDYVLHGHFHEQEESIIGETTVLNPGAHRSALVLDTQIQEYWFVPIDPTM